MCWMLTYIFLHYIFFFAFLVVVAVVKISRTVVNRNAHCLKQRCWWLSTVILALCHF